MKSDLNRLNKLQKIDVLNNTDEKDNGLNVNFVCSDGDKGTQEAVITDLSSADCSDFIFSILEYCDHIVVSNGDIIN